MAAPIQLANGPLPQAPNTTLTGSIPSSGGGTVTVASAAFLPSVGPFLVVVENERLEVASIAGATLTFAAGGRGQEGTAAAAHSSGASVYQVLSVGTLARHIDDRAGGPRIGCRLRRVAALSVTTNVAASLAWDTEDEDTDGFWSSGATVTIPADCGGLYAITGYAGGTIASSTRAYIDVMATTAVTGTPANLRGLAAPAENRFLTTVMLPLLAGDSFIVQVFYSGIAGPVNITGWLTCYRMGL